MKFTKGVYHRALAAARKTEFEIFDETPCKACGKPAQDDWARRLRAAQRRQDQIRIRAKREKGMSI